MTHVGVIGGGAAAVSLLDALSRTARPPRAVTVFEPAPRLWRGRAYQRDLNAVRVNAPGFIMSARHGDDGHYDRWLRRRGPGYARSWLDPRLGVPLLPRGAYGEYLEDTAEEAVRRLAEAGCRVTVVAARVTGVAASGAGYTLRTDDGGPEHEVDRVVHCTGAGTPADVYRLAGTPGYLPDPYPLAETLARIPERAEVAVLGSGLTAVDIAVALADRGHRGGITLISRHRVLPFVWQRPVPVEPVRLTREQLDATAARHGRLTLGHLAELLRAEAAGHGQNLDDLTAEIRDTGREEPDRRLRRQLAETDSPSLGRRLLQAAVHPLGLQAWRLLTEHDRELLRGRYARTVIALSSPMVPHNAAVLLGMFDSGQLTVATAPTGITPSAAGGFRLGPEPGAPVADVVVNAITPRASLVPGADEAADRGLWLVGETAVARAGWLVTPGIPGVAAQAAAVAARLTT
ncbi:FAD/NAD(P)-binding protein [Streptomyces pactum]|uniref:FAD/NAD(P)-binding protein n=1 Tax=Streptomyces pactum TaxID=68249 RepID=A0ABS0NEN7_9ACTN|nr:FAD/NAD(P)-binding protein [Streptomyces pactum]MBH5333660.1 FAD/NAD(P)-binding protein [Streptomyces pactum]